MTQNKEEAAKWYKKAAEAGNADAQCDIGCCYYCGEGVKKDFGKAAEWYKKAAEQGNESAKNAIDRMQGGGLGSAVAAGAALGGAALLWKILRG